MNGTQVVEATAWHFMKVRDTWADKPRSRAKPVIALRHIAAAVAVREGVAADDIAKALSCEPSSIAGMADACERAKKYLMHILDIQKRLAGSP